MKQQLKNLLKKIIHAQGYQVSKIQPDIFSDLKYRDVSNCLEVLHAIKHPDYQKYLDFFDFIKEHKALSVAQNYQDLFVLYHLDQPCGQEFVEFGAADGRINSNTYLLETQYKWTGLLAEPNIGYRERLPQNRRCRIDNRAVFSASNQELTFIQQQDLQLSGIEQTIDQPNVQGQTYQVKTVTLNDLLSENGINPGFGFLSIDVEGAEQEVLKGFNLHHWRPKTVVIEHNFRSDDANGILPFFKKEGYVQMYPALSKYDFWFALEGSC